MLLLFGGEWQVLLRLGGLVVIWLVDRLYRAETGLDVVDGLETTPHLTQFKIQLRRLGEREMVNLGAEIHAQLRTSNLRNKFLERFRGRQGRFLDI